MWVQEIEFDIDRGECLSESGFNEVKEIPVAQLRLAAEQEFGTYHGDLFDPDDETKRIGWKFRAKAKYDNPDMGDEFNLETWVVLHAVKPEMVFTYYTIQDHELQAIDKVDELLGVNRNAEAEESMKPAVEAVTLEDSVASLIKEAEGTGDTPDILDVEEVSE